MWLNLRSFGGAALIVALTAAIVLLVTGPFYRIGLWSLATAFTLMRWAAYGGIAATVIGAGALWHARGRSAFAALSVVIGLVVFALPFRFQRMAAAVPPIHDITTDTANPPTFQAVLPHRTEARNPLDYSQEVARQQREGYPDIKPLVMEVPAAQVFDRAVRAAREAGWDVVEVNAENWRIEATDTTPFFGFKDDIVVRLTPIGSRTVVDVRSVSRIGRSDVGTNARRIRDYLAAISR
jgi:uncharacterized protein (DUF1499 family)